MILEYENKTQFLQTKSNFIVRQLSKNIGSLYNNELYNQLKNGDIIYMSYIYEK